MTEAEEVRIKTQATNAGNGIARSTNSMPKPSLKTQVIEDLPAILILTSLYILQGIPIGIAISLIGILKEKGASFSQISTFMLCTWPFSLKILWAPFVDGLYLQRFGRRKSWLLPVQLLLGAVLLSCSIHIKDWIEELIIPKLTLAMFTLYFLAATQDIAVDGWALTMLKRTGWASTCNSVGQSLGVLLSSTGYYFLAARDFVDLSQFLQICGIVFFIATTAVALFVSESGSCIPHPGDEEGGRSKRIETTVGLENAFQTYKQIFLVMQLQPVKELLLVLFTWKIGFAWETAMLLKLQDKGFSKESVVYIKSLVSPVEFLIPILVSPYTTGPRPLDVSVWIFLPRLCLSVIACGIVMNVPAEINSIFTLLVIVYLIMNTILSQSMFASQLAFFAKVSDPNIGGTYMTLLNTVANLGSLWTAWAATALVDVFTISNTSESDDDKMEIDGFYLTALGCGSLGLLWFIFLRGKLEKLQVTPRSQWLAKNEPPTTSL